MNKIIATMAAVSALAIAAPAVAKPGHGSQQNSYRGGNADANLSGRIEQLQIRLQTGVHSGSITRREATPLRQQMRQLTQLERRYARNGISGQERGDLQRRMSSLRQGIRRADGNNQARWDQYDREDGYGRDGQWSGYSSQGQDQQPGSVLGSVIDAFFGGGDPSVGQRAPSGLYGLESSYRDRYRDGSGAYYRTDGRQIYQIDARTHAVVRVHPMNR